MPAATILGESHENGSIESRQGSLKHAIEQVLLLRGHRKFDELADYRRFITEIVARMNRRVSAKVTEERTTLKPLPVRRTSEYEEVEARVTKYSTVSVKRIEAWLGDVCVFETVRGVVPAGKQRGKVIDYRHLIATLKRKPGAFARWEVMGAAIKCLKFSGGQQGNSMFAATLHTGKMMTAAPIGETLVLM